MNLSIIVLSLLTNGPNCMKVYICGLECVHVYVYVCVCACVCVYMCVYISCIYTCAYTHESQDSNPVFADEILQLYECIHVN